MQAALKVAATAILLVRATYAHVVVLAPQEFSGLELACTNFYNEVGLQGWANLTLQVAKRSFAPALGEHPTEYIQIAALVSDDSVEKIAENPTGAHQLYFREAASAPSDNYMRRSIPGDATRLLPKPHKFIWVGCCAAHDHDLALVKSMIDYIETSPDFAVTIFFDRPSPSIFEPMFNSWYFHTVTVLLILMGFSTCFVGIRFIVERLLFFQRVDKKKGRVQIVVLVIETSTVLFLTCFVVGTWNRSQPSEFFKGESILGGTLSQFLGSILFSFALVWKVWSSVIDSIEDRLQSPGRGTKPARRLCAQLSFHAALAACLAIDFAFIAFFPFWRHNPKISTVCSGTMALAILCASLLYFTKARKIIASIQIASNGNRYAISKTDAAKLQALWMSRLALVAGFAMLLAISPLFAYSIFPALFATLPGFPLATNIGLLARILLAFSQMGMCRLPPRLRDKVKTKMAGKSLAFIIVRPKQRYRKTAVAPSPNS